MRRIILTMVLAAISMLCSTAQSLYSIHSTTSGVKIKTNDTEKPAVAGAPLFGLDELYIPTGGKVEVLHRANNKIYSSTRTGYISVFDLVKAANDEAEGHLANVSRRISFGKNSKNEGTTYITEGGVRRSIAVYDPNGKNIAMDIPLLSAHIASYIRSTDNISFSDTVPVKFTTSRDTLGVSLAFNIENTLDYPFYFNILRVNMSDISDIEISKLGQPMGCYVIQPGQTMSRTDTSDIDSNERHIVLMTPCQFDLDLLIEELKKAVASANSLETKNLPVYVGEIR